MNVTVKDVRVLTYNKDMHNAAYIKTWIGEQALQTNYESAGLPRGGGWYVCVSSRHRLLASHSRVGHRGTVNNLRFENCYIEGAGIGPNINQDSGNNGRPPRASSGAAR